MYSNYSKVPFESKHYPTREVPRLTLRDVVLCPSCMLESYGSSLVVEAPGEAAAALKGELG